MKRLPVLLGFVVLFAVYTTSAQEVQIEQKSVRGDCNVALGINEGNVEVKCGLHEAALKPLANKLNAIRKEQKLQGREIDSLVASVNLLMSAVINAQDRIIAEVRQSNAAQTKELKQMMKETIRQQVDRVLTQIPQRGGEEITRFQDEARRWRKQYEELLARWDNVHGDEQANLALRALQAGDLDRAGSILDDILLTQDQIVDKAAPNHFRRGRVFELQFKPHAALKHYDAAYRFAPNNFKYAHTYAVLLQDQNQFRKAARIYEDNLEGLRELASKNPEAYEPALARTLNNLGALYRSTQRFAAAEKAYGGARDLFRELASKNPEAYEPALAGTLNNLGNLYGATQRQVQAEQAFREALGIRRALAMQEPRAHLKEYRQTLGNLIRLYQQTGEDEKINALYDAEMKAAPDLIKVLPERSEQQPR